MKQEFYKLLKMEDKKRILLDESNPDHFILSIDTKNARAIDDALSV